MTPILLYSHCNEPLTRALLLSSLDQECGLIKLSLKKILEEVSIKDEFDDQEIKISWTLASGLNITNTNNFYLINRVLSVPEEIFNDFAEEDKQYSIAEYRAYLAFAIESFPRGFSRPSAFGLSGNRFSLPRQWEIVNKSKGFLLATPDYYLGNMEMCDLKKDLIYSNPFEFYYWKPNKSMVDIDKFAFVFSKPEGKPFVAFVIENEVKIFSCQEQEEVSLEARNIIEQKSIFLLQLFDYQIAEILFFLNGNNITFGMISNIPLASSKKDWFLEAICNFFKSKVGS